MTSETPASEDRVPAPHAPDTRALEIHPVTPDRWDHVAELFERPGPRGGKQDSANCWCSVWRCTQGDPTTNRQELHDRVTAADEPGLLAYLDGEPVGWVSVEGFPQEQGDYKGKLSTFLDLGFEPVRTEGRRTVVRHSFS